MKRIFLFALTVILTSIHTLMAVEQIPIKVEKHAPGAPITLGIPFPVGALYSPDHVRLLNRSSKEIPCQVTEVTTWEPRDASVKWIWVFFFQGEGTDYILEYGPDVRPAPLNGPKVVMVNNQRTRGYAEINTGTCKFRINKGAGGFLDYVQLDTQRDGFDASDTIATSPNDRGSFLDLIDPEGMDYSKAIVTRTVKEKGSGPLHAILRVEGVYQYERNDNNSSPFILRIHAYAGKSFIKVFHTLTYTGTPDKHQQAQGEHAVIATQKDLILSDETSEDPGWTVPNDQIAAVGLTLNYNLTPANRFYSGYQKGNWWENLESQTFETSIIPGGQLSVFQAGPPAQAKPDTLMAMSNQRTDGFHAAITSNATTKIKAKKAEGWVDIRDEKWGIALGIRHFVEEYPKEISLEDQTKGITAYLWSPKAGPMSFARYSDQPTGQMLGNFAQGLTKTSELVYHFFKSDGQDPQKNVLDYVLDPPIAHAPPQWYTDSKVFGTMAPREKNHEEYERGLDYKFNWILFNQKWEPWYGMFNYGDFKTFYIKNSWKVWSNNEPAQDYMLWLQFIRTGDPKYYKAAEATSRHTMDVDNIHWPQGKKYLGDTNPSLDFWKYREEPKGTPYLGIGRRHSHQHWTALLSAHVWIQGWITSYYVSGYHRGLEVAQLTADTYAKRIWGDHDLTGRRLYLSVWNMVEVWDATKNEIYRLDLEDRINRMIGLQQGPDQCNSLVIDRYGYAQVYASQGLAKYYQLTNDAKIKSALIRHARSVRDNPPWNHKYESYLSTIHSLLMGYELCGEKSFLEEAISRSQVLKTDKLKDEHPEAIDQYQLAMALEKVSHMPRDNGYHEGADYGMTIWDISQGLRVYGWTHAYNVPYLLYWLRKK